MTDATRKAASGTDHDRAVPDDLAWRRCRRALAVEVSRVTELLRSLPTAPPAAAPSAAAPRPATPQPAAAPPAVPPDADPKIVGDWNLLDVAVHLSQAWLAIPGLARADLSELDAVVPDRGAGASVARSIDQLGQVTSAAVAAEPERDPAVLADRIAERARDYLAGCAGRSPDERLPWLITGIFVPPPVFTAHLLSETVVHGWDIARAAGRRARIVPEHAALVVRHFLLDVLLAGGRVMFDDPARLAAARGRYQISVRGYDTVRIVLDDAGARLDTEPGRPDCRLSVDPVTFLLMFFGRRSVASAAARGHLFAWGRRPWLAARLQRALPRP